MMKKNKINKKLVLGVLLLALIGIPTTKSLACTIFTVSSGDTVLFANNEDNGIMNAIIGFYPPSNGGYGSVKVGFFSEIEDGQFKSINYEGAMNDQGLAWDINSVPTQSMNPHPEKPYRYSEYLSKILREASTVAEAIELANLTHFAELGDSMSVQIHIADATGDAVIISPGTDGELAFTRKEPGDGFLISTNVNRAQSEISCKRYETAATMLKNLDLTTGFTVEYARSILEAVHFEGGWDFTVYSNIFDLKNGLIYLWYFHQYEEVVVFNLAEELAKGRHILQIRDLFSQEINERVDQETQRYQMGFLGTMASIALVSMGIVFFRGRRIRKTILSYQLTPKRKKLHQVVMLSGLVGGMIFLLLLGLIIAIILNGNYFQFGLQPFIPLFPVLAITGGYAMLIEIYHVLHRRTLTTALHSQKSEQVS